MLGICYGGLIWIRAESTDSALFFKAERFEEASMKVYLYPTRVKWDGERKGTAEVFGKPPLAVAAPPEFKGHPGIWSPEDLFVSAIETCFMLTYVSFCQAESIELLSYESEARGTLEKGLHGMAFSKVEICPRIEVRSRADRAQELVEKAKAVCMVGRSVACEILVHAQMRESPSGHPGVPTPEWTRPLWDRVGSEMTTS